jgi:hypothetical protein
MTSNGVEPENITVEMASNGHKVDEGNTPHEPTDATASSGLLHNCCNLSCGRQECACREPQPVQIASCTISCRSYAA